MVLVWQKSAASVRLATLVGLSFTLGSCSTVYYRALETVGIEKRDVLVDRVQEARDSQAVAKEQFSSALEHYRAIVEIDGGDLESIYDRLSREYQRSDRRAEQVRDRISAVQAVAEDLFDEWEAEIDTYSDPGLRLQSQVLLDETQAEYQQLIAAMGRAESAMDPVLVMFNDQVLILRHNLNARAIGALRTELQGIEEATEALILEMERSIEEASRFISAMV